MKHRVLDIFYLRDYYMYDIASMSVSSYNDKQAEQWLTCIEYIVDRLSYMFKRNSIYTRINLSNNSFIVNCCDLTDTKCDMLELRDAYFKPFVKVFTYQATGYFGDRTRYDESHFNFWGMDKATRQVWEKANKRRFHHYTNKWCNSFELLSEKEYIEQYVILSVPQYLERMRNCETLDTDDCFYRGRHNNLMDEHDKFDKHNFSQLIINGKRIFNGVVGNIVHVNNEINRCELDKIINISLFGLNLSIRQMLIELDDVLERLNVHYWGKNEHVLSAHKKLVQKTKKQIENVDLSNAKNITPDAIKIDDFCRNEDHLGLIQYLRNISYRSKYNNPINFMINHILLSGKLDLTVAYISMLDKIISL